MPQEHTAVNRDAAQTKDVLLRRLHQKHYNAPLLPFPLFDKPHNAVLDHMHNHPPSRGKHTHRHAYNTAMNGPYAYTCMRQSSCQDLASLDRIASNTSIHYVHLHLAGAVRTATFTTHHTHHQHMPNCLLLLFASEPLCMRWLQSLCQHTHQYTPRMRSTFWRHMGQGVPTLTMGAHSLHRHLCTLAPCSSPTSRGALRQITHSSASEPPTYESAASLAGPNTAAAGAAAAGGAEGTSPSDRRMGPNCCCCVSLLLVPCAVNGLPEAVGTAAACVKGLLWSGCCCCCCCCGRVGAVVLPSLLGALLLAALDAVVEREGDTVLEPPGLLPYIAARRKAKASSLSPGCAVNPNSFCGCCCCWYDAEGGAAAGCICSPACIYGPCCCWG
jgi:hypothetical protein